METIRLIALLILLSLLLISCSGTPSDTLSYQQKPFRAHLSWQTDALSFCAVMTSYPATESLTLEFTAPESVSGIAVKKCGEETTVTLDGIEISAPHLSRFAEISRFFEIDGTLKKSSVTTVSGVKLNCIEVLNADKENLCLYLYPRSGLPRRIVGELFGNQVTLDIISFEPIPE